MADKFYLTTTLPYVNAKPHMGHALEFVQADACARFQKLCDKEVFFNIGTDEHGVKVLRKAQEEGKDVQVYVDEYAKSFKDFAGLLNIDYTNFIRTTDPSHEKAAQEFWKRCDANGDIYKKTYKVKYCVGCELEKTDSELEEGRCPIHPNIDVEEIEEENYFFKFSNYGEKLLDLYKNREFVVPEKRLNEIEAFVERGLEDFSISRLKEKMPWGVPVPGDESQVMYVWFDALVNYVSTLGWPEDESKFKDFWPGIQIAGKDNLRQQSAMWQAMLMSAGLPTSKQIMIHGFITSGGQKMSKSLGNVIDPVEVVNEYGVDALRYFLLREINSFEDSDFTVERFVEAYNANLANGLGNLVARVIKLAEDNLEEPVKVENVGYKFDQYIIEKFSEFRFDLAMDYIWDKIGLLDGEIQEKKPWESKDKELIKTLVTKVYQIGCKLEPFMPATSEKIKQAIKENKKPETLFERK